MTEQRTEYTVTGLQIENELLRERVEALRKTVDGFTDAGNQHWDSQNRRIKELEAQVARLEADNKRMRHLDSMPYWSIVQVANDPQLWSWSAIQEIKAWVDAQDGDA